MVIAGCHVFRNFEARYESKLEVVAMIVIRLPLPLTVGGRSRVSESSL
jgi:hypothetical protein